MKNSLQVESTQECETKGKTQCELGLLNTLKYELHWCIIYHV